MKKSDEKKVEKIWNLKGEATFSKVILELEKNTSWIFCIVTLHDQVEYLINSLA